MALVDTEQARTRRRPRRAHALITSLAVAAAFAVVCGGSVARADNAAAVVYNSIPSPLPPNMISQGFQSNQVSEVGDFVHLSGTNRMLRTVTVTMSDWALKSTPANVTYCVPTANCFSSGGSDGTGGFFYPITLDVYAGVPGTPNTKGALLATVTQPIAVPWRPPAATSPACPNGTAWRAGDGNCYNGYAFNATFDLGGLNVTLPDDVVIGVAYNTMTYGAHPIGVDGPYNSLNVGLVGTPNPGDNPDRVFLNSSNPQWYNGGGAGGTFREDTGWTGNGTVPFTITAASSIPSDVYVNPAFTGNGDPDGAGPASSIGYDAFSTVQAWDQRRHRRRHRPRGSRHVQREPERRQERHARR